MKKIEYFAPETEVIKLNFAKVICASDGTGGSAGLSDDEEEGDPS